MSTPATATLPPHQTHYHGYSHHQTYQANAANYRANNSLLNGAARLGGTTYNNHTGSSTTSHNTTNGVTPSSSSRPPVVDPQSNPRSEGQYHTESPAMPPSKTESSDRALKRKQPSRQPDWKNFYKNGLPDEVIVIDDSPPPRISESIPLPQADNTSNGHTNGWADGRDKHAAKKRKREAAGQNYDPVYNTTGNNSTGETNGYKKSVSGSTISTDRTTSALHTTAATSLGSNYSAGGVGNNGYYDDVQPGQKRKRVATRQQIAQEAKRREIETKSDKISYQPPKKPTTKSSEVSVRLVHDHSYSKSSKVDDDDGHFIVVPDTDLTPRYQIHRLLGQGTFGKVVQAKDRERKGAAVAIKVIRSVQKYRDASRIELRVLNTLKMNDEENRNRCIHLRDCFDWRGHICIVMDLLGQSVFDFLKSNSFVPFPNSQIQNFARQLFTSVAFLHDLNLIHTDLKPENILLCENGYQTFTYNRKIPSSSLTVNRQAGQRRVLLDTEIRLIDFGSATFQEEYHSSVVSTRHYRAPEIILGLGWSFPCDIWSIGCILVEFFTGDALFQTHDNLEHLAMMEPVCDAKLDTALIQQVNKMASRSAGNAASKYFKRLKLDYPTPDTSRASRRFVKAMKKLTEIIPGNNPFTRNFLDLLKKIFVYDPAKRITAHQALDHPWFKEVAAPDDGTEATKIRIQRELEAEKRAYESKGRPYARH